MKEIKLRELPYFLKGLSELNEYSLVWDYIEPIKVNGHDIEVYKGAWKSLVVDGCIVGLKPAYSVDGKEMSATDYIIEKCTEPRKEEPKVSKFRYGDGIDELKTVSEVFEYQNKKYTEYGRGIITEEEMNEYADKLAAKLMEINRGDGNGKM